MDASAINYCRIFHLQTLFSSPSRRLRQSCCFLAVHSHFGCFFCQSVGKGEGVRYPLAPPPVAGVGLPLWAGSSVLVLPGSIATCLAACPFPGPAACHSTNCCGILSASLLHTGSGGDGPNIPFHEFPTSTAMSSPEHRHVGQEYPGSAQHWPCALLSLLWGSLSTPQAKGCQVLRCWKSSRALS